MSRKNANGSSITDIVGVMPRTKLDGGNPDIWYFPELGAETFKAGEMVCLSGSTTTRLGLTQPGTNASGYGIIGFAADPALGATSSVIGVWPVTDSAVFVGNVGHSNTSASAITNALDWGQLYGLTSLSGVTYVDKAKGLTMTSTAMCRVIGFYEQDVVPTYYGRVYFQVTANKSQINNNIWQNTSSDVSMAV